MSGSLLNALDLAELITTNVDQYGQTAIELARAPAKLTEIRNRLAAAVREGEVFNAQRSAQRLEDAYTAMYRIAVNKAGPQQSSRSTPLDAGPMSISATCL
jgi:predicted O-linked N-acetylglucosamine transferase (SPINDLY family)